MNIRNELVINEPTLLEDWDYSRNNEIGLYPDKVTTGSNKKAFWICKNCGNSYPATVKSKSKSKYGCPNCVRKYAGINSRKTKTVGIASLAESHPHLVAEWLECEDESLTPYNATAGSGKRVKWQCQTCNGIYTAIIANRALKNSNCPYCAGIKALSGFNDLATVNPQLAEEWSPRNDSLPSDFLPFSHQKVYWICYAGHEDYLCSIQVRSLGQGCRICASESHTSFPEQAIFYFIKKVFSDAENRYKYADKYEIDIYIPTLAVGIEYNGYFAHKKRAEKDKTKKAVLEQNGIRVLIVKEYKLEKEKHGADYYIRDAYTFEELDLLISHLLLGLCGSIPVSVDVRNQSISIREQYLRSRKENSIVVQMPQLLDEWDYERNGKIKPEFVSFGSNHEYYWICPKCSTSYLASAKKRSAGDGCPYCAGKRVLSGVNDFATRYPELLDEWDYDKNTIAPNEIYGGGRNKVYFKCTKGHSYKRKIDEKIKGQGCPFCAGKQVLSGFNDLLSQKPDLALDWDYSKNNVSPDKVHANSFKKYFWKCHVCGYEWKFAVMQRINCPNCTSANKKINVYTLDGILVGSYIGRQAMCTELNIQLKSFGNISSVCMRKQKTLLSRYVLRYDRDDEFKGHTKAEIQTMIADYLGDAKYDTKQNPYINVYDIVRFEFIATFNGAKELCYALKLPSRSNISTVCQRRQKTILSRYILRYDYDDEFKGLTNSELKNKIQEYLLNPL